MTANLISVLSDGTLLIGFVTGAIAVGRKIGSYERRIADMKKQINAACADIQTLDLHIQENDKATARYEEKLDNAIDILKEVKSMVLQHVTNGNGKS